MVTHDQDEAFALGDRIGLMNAGSIVQIGTGKELYSQPRNQFAAQFVGESNVFSGMVEAESGVRTLRCGEYALLLPDGLWQIGSEATLLVRPEHVDIRTSPATSGVWVRSTVLSVNFRGLGWRYEVESELGVVLAFQPASKGELATAGDVVFVSWEAADSRVLPV
jgi:ABC-type Fe3+/spermidine/putrescine transport system ATPase subunit